MHFMDAAKFRQEHNYAVAQSFAKDGVEASWAENQPAVWGTEKSKISLTGPASAGALSQDNALLALGVDRKVFVYDMDSLELRETLESSRNSISHVEWQPNGSTENYVLLAGPCPFPVAFESPRSRNGCVGGTFQTCQSRWHQGVVCPALVRRHSAMAVIP